MDKSNNKSKYMYSNIVISVLFIFCLILSFQLILPTMSSGDTLPLTENWTYTTGDSSTPIPIMLPTNDIDNPKNKSVYLSTKLTDDFFMGASIMLESLHQKSRIYLDDELLLTYGYDRRPPLGKSFGNATHIVRLPENYPGKTLTIEHDAFYSNYASTASSVNLGTKSSLVFKLIKEHLLGSIVGALLFTLGVASLIYYITAYKRVKKTKLLACISSFSLFTGLFILAQNQLLQFFINVPSAVYYLSVLCQILIPLPFFHYLSTKYVFGKKTILSVLIVINRILITSILILQIVSLVDIISILPYYNLFIFAEVIVIFYLAIRNRRKKICQKIILSFFFLLVATFLGFIITSINPQANLITYIQYGLLSFTLILWSDAARYIVAITQDKALDSALVTLAYCDTMTGLKNRTAFQEHIDKLDSELTSLEGVAIAVADLNFLKFINDNLGHKKGDAAITLCGTTLTQSFSKIGTPYRIGGDEFAVILENTNVAQTNSAINSFRRLSKLYSKTHPHDVFSVALGVEHFNASIDSNINDLFTRADTAMYTNKLAIKAAKNNRYRLAKPTDRPVENPFEETNKTST